MINLFSEFMNIFLLNIKKPLIGSEVFLPNSKFTTKIRNLEAKSLKKNLNYVPFFK